MSEKVRMGVNLPKYDLQCAVIRTKLMNYKPSNAKSKDV
jgi:hypothetical protein